MDSCRVKNAETLCLGLVAVAVFLVVMPLFKAAAGVLSQMTPASISASVLHKCLRQVYYAKVIAVILLCWSIYALPYTLRFRGTTGSRLEEEHVWVISTRNVCRKSSTECVPEVFVGLWGLLDFFAQGVCRDASNFNVCCYFIYPYMLYVLYMWTRSLNQNTIDAVMGSAIHSSLLPRLWALFSGKVFYP